MKQEFLNSSTPKDGMRQSARLFCCLFACVFAICFIAFFILAITGFVNYANNLNSPAYAGMDPSNGLGRSFDASKLQELARAEAIATYGEVVVNETPTLIENVKTTILSKYSLRNGVYYYNCLPIIDPKYWHYLIVSVCLLILLVIQICSFARLEKAKYTEYYTLIVLLFISLNMPSAILAICGRKN